jgi:hypothetical protein
MVLPNCEEQATGEENIVTNIRFKETIIYICK